MSAEKVTSPSDSPEKCCDDENSSAEVNTSNGSDADTHVKPSHSAVQIITRFMCKFCGKQFIRRADMDAHASLHDDERPPLTCGVCGKVYNTRSKLQRHVRVHSGERPFPCTICGKRFPRSDHVKQHMRVHARFSGESISTPSPLGLTHKSHCRLCGVKFEDRSELGKHLLTHGFNKLYSCIYCGEVFESNDKLKAHRLVHENHVDEFLPVLSVPDPTMSSKSSTSLTKNIVKKKKPGRPKGSKTITKRRKDMTRLGFSKFKIARRSGSESWQTIAPLLKTEEAATSSDQSHSAADRAMPILERILTESNRPGAIKSEKEIGDEEGGEVASNKSDASDVPQMEITACYSLAEGQDNSDIPDIDEIRASTLSDGNNMIVVPSSSGEMRDDEEDMPHSDEEGEVEGTPISDAQNGTSVCAVTGTRTDSEHDARSTQTNPIRPTVLPTVASAAATLMTLQQQVYPQIASTIVTSPANMASMASTTAVTTRPTISLLPNVLAFRTHPLLTTPTLNLANAVQPTATGSIYNTANRLYNPIGSLTTANPAFQCGFNIPSLDTFPQGRKMMRCPHCCIWFEDSALGLLHQSLHSADETDPFTCKKCLKRLGNRLEFTAHIIWHLDPTMEESAVL